MSPLRPGDRITAAIDEAAAEWAARYVGGAYVWPVDAGAVTLHLPPALTPDEALILLARIGALLVAAVRAAPVVDDDGDRPAPARADERPAGAGGVLGAEIAAAGRAGQHDCRAAIAGQDDQLEDGHLG